MAGAYSARSFGRMLKTCRKITPSIAIRESLTSASCSMIHNECYSIVFESYNQHDCL